MFTGARIFSLVLLLSLLQGCATGFTVFGPLDSSWGSERSGSQQGIHIIGRVLEPRRGVGPMAFRIPAESYEVQASVLDISAHEKRSFERNLVKGQPYAKFIRDVLHEHGVPEDLLYLAYVESNFNPNALSHQGAAGVWQFTKATARRYGLKVSGKIDERRDVKKSTYAAARMLADLYEMFGDWNLVLAAYNSGPGRVSRAIERGGTRDFFELAQRDLLPEETRKFVPRVYAVAMVAGNPSRYGIDAPVLLAKN